MTSVDCPIYFVDPNITGGNCSTSTPPVEESSCAECCNCGYLQFESLLSYLEEINDKLKEDKDKFVELEFKLREQIIEISRLFDLEAGVQPGFFAKSHYKTTRVTPTNGTRFLKIEPHVAGTLEVRTSDNVLLDASSYSYTDGFLVYLPCAKHESCGCSTGCGSKKAKEPLPWPNSCYKLTARWGAQCSDFAVQKAVRDYLIEGYRMQDPIVSNINGIPISRGFKVPHSWGSYIANFKKQRAFFTQFAIA